jgi:polysaccharide biosynthesis/export protein
MLPKFALRLMREPSRIVAATVAALVLSASTAFAQAREAQAQVDDNQPVPAAAGAPLLDGAVDRASYRLGPGDVLTIALMGDVNRQFTATVSPEGIVVVPTVGVVNVLDANLDDAQARVRRQVLRLYRNLEVSVTLSRLRTFRVYVLGAVTEPGMRVATPATRVSDLIPAPPEGDGGPIRRNIRVRRSGGDALDVDLLAFSTTGDLDANPTVREGDVILVAPVDETVNVQGRVTFPGRYEYREGESLARLLSLVNGRGRLPADAADTIRVSRVTPGGAREVLRFSQAEALGTRGEAFMLLPFDAIFVPALGDFMLQHSADVVGQVARPGRYPIEPNVTTVRDLVRLAGGLLPDASVAAATLRRAPPGVAVDPLRQVPLEALTPEERRVMQARTLGDQSNVVLDFARLFAGEADALDQPLLSGDVLNVPRHRDEVLVLGAVGQPGILPFVEGRTIDQYLALAGGVSSRADRRAITVLRAGGTVELAGREVRRVEPGDHIVIPFRAHRTALERWQIVNSVAWGVIATVLAASQILGR